MTGIEPNEFTLYLPKGFNTSTIADFLDGVPGMEVWKIGRDFRYTDEVRLRSKLSVADITEEVCNALNDVFERDVRIVRGSMLLHSFLSLPASPQNNCNCVTV